MTKDLKSTVSQIDSLIRQHKWFDFQVLNYDGSKLTIAGGVDLTYHHELEISFEEVFFVSGFFSGWRSDTTSTVFFLPENEIELNKKFEIEQGYQLFIFRTEDYKNDFIIAAKSLQYQDKFVS